MALSDKKSIVKAVGNLINSGKLVPKKMSMPKIKVKNIWPKHSYRFSTLLKGAMNNKIYNLCHQYNEPSNILAAPHDPYPDDASIVMNRDFAIMHNRWQPEKLDLYRTICRLGLTYTVGETKFAMVKFFGCSLDKNRRDATAAKAIAEVLEPLAQRGFIKGSLTPLSKMRLMDHDDITVSSRKVIMCYVAVTDLGEAYLAANPTQLEFSEGGMPNELP